MASQPLSGVRWRPVGRRLFLAGATSLAAAAIAGCTQDCAADAVTRRALVELAGFRDWLTQHGVMGTVGEVGWPRGTDWARLASAWLDRARAAHLSVFAWAAAPWWTWDHPLAFYRSGDGTATLTDAGSQGIQFETAMRDGLVGGIGLAEATFGADFSDSGTYSSARPGTLGIDYTYPSAGSLRYLAGRGYRDVRLAFTWERLQRDPGGALDVTEVGRLRQVLRDAAGAGLSVVLQLHNFGRYAGWRDGRRQVWPLGSSELPASALADFWVRLGTATSGLSRAGYDLMNEPHDLPGGALAWEAASAQAAGVIRAMDASNPIFVGGYDWSSVASFPSTHPKPWVDVPGVVYNAHQYFDADHSGTYRQSYVEVDASIRARGGSRCG